MSEEKGNSRLTPVGRLAFDKHLYKPNEKGRYSVCLVFDKTEDNINALKSLKEGIKAAVSEKWPDKKPSNLFFPLKEETREDMLEKYPFMENRIVLNASSGFEIGVIDRNNQEVFPNDMKTGDQVRIAVTPYAYDNQSKGVGLNADGLQFIREDEGFYSRRSVVDMFSESVIPGDAPSESKTEEKSNDYNSYGF